MVRLILVAVLLLAGVLQASARGNFDSNIDDENRSLVQLKIVSEIAVADSDEKCCADQAVVDEKPTFCTLEFKALLACAMPAPQLVSIRHAIDGSSISHSVERNVALRPPIS